MTQLPTLPKRYFAQVDIVHDGNLIERGDELPEDFPRGSLIKLILEKVVAETPPPGLTKIVRDTALSQSPSD